jgi:hypothetical protein
MTDIITFAATAGSAAAAAHEASRASQAWLAAQEGDHTLAEVERGHALVGQHIIPGGMILVATALALPWASEHAASTSPTRHLL